MAKRFDPKAKAKRQKIVAGVLGLVFVAVLIFQGPTIMGMFGGSSSSTASEPVPVTPPPAPAPATPAAGSAGATPVALAGGSAQLVDSDPAPVPADGQLVSFDRFESKDPFVPQGVTATPDAAPAQSVPVNPEVKADAPEGVVTTSPPPPPAAPSPASQPARATTATTATITVNGTPYEVTVGESFPEADPIFKLVSLRRGTARVGIAGGSYANGSPAVSLKKGGKPLTLMNTADGTTYVLRLVSVQ
jgi:hypothetical protein